MRQREINPQHVTAGGVTRNSCIGHGSLSINCVAKNITAEVLAVEGPLRWPLAITIYRVFFRLSALPCCAITMMLALAGNSLHHAGQCLINNVLGGLLNWRLKLTRHERLHFT